jgi:hypothetical protein
MRNVQLPCDVKLRVRFYFLALRLLLSFSDRYLFAGMDRSWLLQSPCQARYQFPATAGRCRTAVKSIKLDSSFNRPNEYSSVVSAKIPLLWTNLAAYGGRARTWLAPDLA